MTKIRIRFRKRPGQCYRTLCKESGFPVLIRFYVDHYYEPGRRTCYSYNRYACPEHAMEDKVKARKVSLPSTLRPLSELWSDYV